MHAHHDQSGAARQSGASHRFRPAARALAGSPRVPASARVPHLCAAEPGAAARERPPLAGDGTRAQGPAGTTDLGIPSAPEVAQAGATLAQATGTGRSRLVVPASRGIGENRQRPAPADGCQSNAQAEDKGGDQVEVDRKSTRLNSSHVRISYAVFCLKKKTQDTYPSQ